MLSLIWVKWTQVKCFVNWLTWTRSYDNWWGRWWMDSERQTIKSHLLLLDSESQQERRCLSSTLLVLPGQMQSRCSAVRRTCHAYTTCLVQETRRSHQRHEFAGEVCRCEDSQRMTTWGTHWSGHKAWTSSHPVKTVSFQTHQRALTCVDESSRADSKAVLALVASISDAGARAIRHTHRLGYSSWAASATFWPASLVQWSREDHRLWGIIWS